LINNFKCINQKINEEKFNILDKEFYYLKNDIKTDRDTIFLIHGFPDNAYCWIKQMEFLAEDYNVFSPFLPGAHVNDQYGEVNSNVLEIFTINILEVLKKNEISKTNKIFLLGHDIGGVFVDELRCKLGNRIGGIIFINSMNFNMFVGNLGIRQIVKSWYMPMLQIPGIKKLLLSQNEKVRKFINFYSSRNIDEEKNQGNLFSMYLYTGILRSKIKGIALFTPPPSSVKSLFIFNKEDPFIEIPAMNLLEKHFCDPILKILDGGHWSYFENAIQINKEIRDFLSEQDKELKNEY